MRNTLILIAVLLVFTGSAHATCSGSGTAWSCTAGSNAAQINAVINAAPSGSDNTVITFDPGNYGNWGTVSFRNDAGVTLICRSTPQTIGASTTAPCNVTLGSWGNPVSGQSFSGTLPYLYRISGFTFDGGGAGVTYPFIMLGSNNTWVQKFRFDHNSVGNVQENSYIFLLGVADNSVFQEIDGVVDHNRFWNGNQGGAVWFMYGGKGQPETANGVWPWPNSTVGTSRNLFIEDNTFNIATLVNQSNEACTDTWGVTGYVVRHNTSINCDWAAHGVDHGPGGILNYEFYNNNISYTNANDSTTQRGFRMFHHQGSGQVMVFNNTFTPQIEPIDATAISVAYYQESQCNGSRPEDGNRAGESGYPCWHQPGRDFNHPAIAYPMYNWNNVEGNTGALVPLDMESAGVHFRANRDAFTAVSTGAQTSASSPFNGTTGMGFGTLSRRPTTCTRGLMDSQDVGVGGVGYFATDQGSQGTLYTCTATNTWTVAYQPYTYPHPLVSAASQSCLISPTSLPTYTAGQTVSEQFTQSGCNPSTFAVVAGSLVASGLSLSSSGLLSGTAVAGTFNFTVGYDTATDPLSLTISPASAPAVSLDSVSHNFGSVMVGVQSAGFAIHLQNTGNAVLSIRSIGPNGDFGLSSNCPISPGTLGIGSSCTITATFTPAQTGARAGSIVVSDDATDSPQTISLSGTGLAAQTGSLGTGISAGQVIIR